MGSEWRATEIIIINDKQPAGKQTSGKSFRFSSILAVDKMARELRRSSLARRGP